jgi:hypothetical protein
VHVAALVQQLDAQRLVEPLDRVLGPAVGALQRDSAVRQRRADLHDRPAVARLHEAQCRHRAVHVPQVADLRRPLELGWGDLVQRCEDRAERDVHPDVDRAQPLLDVRGGLVHGVAVGDVEGQHERLAAGVTDLLGGGLQTGLAARDQADLRAAAGEGADDGPPDPATGARDDDDLRHDRCPIGCEASGADRTG